jgi:S-DNA-T family DNA segregation ATPase FtsK/SpoIIIE
MRVELLHEGRGHDLDVDVDDDTPIGVVAAALARAVGRSSLAGEPEAGLWVGTRAISPDLTVARAGLIEGMAVSLVPPTEAEAEAEAGPDPSGAGNAVVEVRITAGLIAGRCVRLGAGSHPVGRAADVSVWLPSLTVCPRHAVLDVGTEGSVTIRDLGSVNGTRVDGSWPMEATPVGAVSLVEVGAVHVEIGPLDEAQGVALGPGPRPGTVGFNRPPRPALLSGPAAVRLPAAPSAPAPGARFGWAALLAPVVMGIGMAVLFNPLMAVFALFSPVMMLGNWLEDKRRLRTEKRRGQATLAVELARLEADLSAAAAAERARRRSIGTGPHGASARAGRTSRRLWERRAHHTDFLVVSVGDGDVPWEPPVVDGAGGARPLPVDAAIKRSSVIDRCPVLASLAAGQVLGIAGDEAVATAVARTIALQLAVDSGPADVRIAVLVDEGRVDEWDWATWLPHTAVGTDPAGPRLLASDPVGVSGVLDALERDSTSHATVVIVDGQEHLQGRRSRLRALVASGAVGAVVVAPSVEQLPSVCSAVLELRGSDGDAALSSNPLSEPVPRLLAAGAERDVARSIARALASVDDPEAGDETSVLPPRVALADLLQLDAIDGPSLRRRWASAGLAPRLAVPIGVAESGPVVIDLEADGPHGLVAGTTGSGKSELLRTLVAGLAATVGPDALNFVLIDYKGGSAFAECARLPHTVGMVTDLDEHLAERALRCLEAELRYREQCLRQAGVPDLAALLAAPALPSLPRLLVVIDEFATMASDIPDFLDSLVGIAQRGRSLGVHLILATQRPSGAVNDNIKANTNLRLALRVQDASDSSDVIGDPVAASVDRRVPGRGYLRLGPSELIAFQAALVSEASASTVSELPPTRAIRFGHEPMTAVGLDHSPADAVNDLVAIVQSAGEAAADLGLPEARRPWPDPLPRRLLWDNLSVASDDEQGVAIGLVDEPDRQRQRRFMVDLDRGNLLLYGVVGSGTTTALSALAMALAADADAASLHLYVIDFGTGALAGLAELPHCGAVVTAAERERQERLIRQLGDELDRRRTSVARGAIEDWPRVVVLVDGYGGFHAAFDDPSGIAHRDAFIRLVADGPGVGINVVIAADRPSAVPSSVAALVSEKLVFRLADRNDAALFGLSSRDLPSPVPGRAIDVASRRELQVALPPPVSDIVRSAVAVDPVLLPSPVATLPDVIGVADIAHAARLTDHEWFIPVGIGDRALAPAGLVLREGEGAVICGPPQSGKSTTLSTVAAVVAKAGGTTITGIALRRSALRDCSFVDRLVTEPSDIAAVLEVVGESPGPQLVVVDDADLFDDPDGALVSLLERCRPDVHVVAAGRADALRSGFTHWTRELRRSRQGVALRPQLDHDGELWQTPLPRRGPTRFEPGRGFLVGDGWAELVQVAQP